MGEDEVVEQPAGPIPAVVMAGDRGAAKAVAGQSKPYLELAGRSLVAHAVAVLQDVPEVSEVWAVGDAQRLEGALSRLSSVLTKPLRIVPQFRNLYENAWLTYRRALPGAGPEGRDPSDAEAQRPFLYLSADIPFATPQEIRAFIARSLSASCDYALGLSEASSLRSFGEDEPAFQTAYFNLREGRFRQNNLHLVKPARIGRRQLIGEMYQHRYQRELGNALSLAWQTFRREGGGVAVLYYYGLMHLAGWFDRRGMRRAADRLRRGVLASERGIVYFESAGDGVPFRRHRYGWVCDRYRQRGTVGCGASTLRDVVRTPTKLRREPLRCDATPVRRRL